MIDIKTTYDLCYLVDRKGSVLVDILLKYYNELYEGITVLQDAIYRDKQLGSFPVSPAGLFTVDGKIVLNGTDIGYNKHRRHIYARTYNVCIMTYFSM